MIYLPFIKLAGSLLLSLAEVPLSYLLLSNLISVVASGTLTTGIIRLFLWPSEKKQAQASADLKQAEVSHNQVESLQIVSEELRATAQAVRPLVESWQAAVKGQAAAEIKVLEKDAAINHLETALLMAGQEREQKERDLSDARDKNRLLSIEVGQLREQLRKLQEAFDVNKTHIGS